MVIRGHRVLIADETDDPATADGETTSPVARAPAEARTLFAARLRAAIERRGWSLSETARQASRFVTEGRMSRAHVWHYARGKAVPRPRYLFALSQALGVRPDHLFPPGMLLPPTPDRTSAPDGLPPAVAIRLQDKGDGTVLLEFRQHLPWETAMRILRIAKEHPDPPLD